MTAADLLRAARDLAARRVVRGATALTARGTPIGPTSRRAAFFDPSGAITRAAADGFGRDLGEVVLRPEYREAQSALEAEALKRLPPRPTPGVGSLRSAKRKGQGAKHSLLSALCSLRLYTDRPDVTVEDIVSLFDAAIAALEERDGG